MQRDKPLPPTAEQTELAKAIEMKMRRLLGAGLTDLEIIIEMHSSMPASNRLMVEAEGGQDALIGLCQQYPSFHRYTKILADLGGALRANNPALVFCAGAAASPPLWRAERFFAIA